MGTLSRKELTAGRTKLKPTICVVKKTLYALLRQNSVEKKKSMSMQMRAMSPQWLAGVLSFSNKTPSSAHW